MNVGVRADNKNFVVPDTNDQKSDRPLVVIRNGKRGFVESAAMDFDFECIPGKVLKIPLLMSEMSAQLLWSYSYYY